MVSCVYVEAAVREHPRTLQLLKRLHKLPLIEIEHYGEVFNPRSQNFRLQKKIRRSSSPARCKGRF